MTDCRRTPWAQATLAAVVVGLLSSAAVAQNQDPCPERLAPEMLIAENLNSQQQRQITEYAGCWAARIVDADERQITRARMQLREPLGQQGSSTAFNNLYDQVVAEELAPAMQDEREIVRLNTMIVVTRLSRESALPLVADGLADDNPAVRYWAAKAVRNLAGQTQIRSPQRLELLSHLTDLLQQEDAEAIVEQVMLAIVELEIPQAQREMLNAMDGRIRFHMQNPGQPLRAERSAMNRLFQQLISQAANDPSVEPIIRQLAQVALRYHDFAALQLESREAELNQRLEDDYRQAIGLTDQILRFIHEGRGQQSAPPSIANAVRVGDWSYVRAQAEQWRTILSRPPFNFQREQLELPQPEQTATP